MGGSQGFLDYNCGFWYKGSGAESCWVMELSQGNLSLFLACWREIAACWRETQGSRGPPQMGLWNILLEQSLEINFHPFAVSEK